MEALKWIFRIIGEGIVPPKYKQAERDTSANNNIICLNLRRDSYTDGLNNWKYRRNAIIDMIDHYKPGVFCVQECMPHMWRFLKKNTKENYNGFFLDAFTKKISFIPVSEGIGIIYADYYKCFDKGYFNLSKKFGFKTKNWRVCQYVGLTNTITGESFYVFNTHLDHESREARIEGCALIDKKIKEITGSYQTFICGDFNAEVTWHGVKEFAEIYYCDALPTTVTWFGKKNGEICIDFIFSKYDTKPHYYNIITDTFGVPYLSDHYPLILQKYGNN